MSTEGVDTAEAARAQGFPDRTGWKPDNPYLASFRPFIPSNVVIPELTIRAIVVGTVLGIIFGASSLYLVLKVGLTVSASIPVAVISITLFRVLSKVGVRNATILENNIVQTAGSAGESIAFGLGVTMPAILILGFDLDITRVMLVAVLGGLLGILMMIPLRRALIVQQHGILEISRRHGLRGGLKGRRFQRIARCCSQGSVVCESGRSSDNRRQNDRRGIRNRLRFLCATADFQDLERNSPKGFRSLLFRLVQFRLRTTRLY